MRTNTNWSPNWLPIISGCLVLSVGVGAQSTDAWEAALKRAAFTREGLERLYNPHFQYACIGLGGTTMRVGPHGFTRPGAPRVMPGGYLQHLPYLAYEYWWDEEAHRHLPFDLTGGYGDNVEPGQVFGYREHLDIFTGLLTIDLELRTDPVWEGLYQIGRNAFKSRRELFVTPEGVLIVRVTDSTESESPFRLGIHVNRDVRIYLNQGIYDKEHPPWDGFAEERSGGIVLTATRPRSCVATLAIATDIQEPYIDADNMRVGSEHPGQTLTFYIAPGSSYADSDPVQVAWAKADRARTLGFEAQRQATAAWWQNFHNRSFIVVPDEDIMRWYIRSLYYHGVYYGNTHIPPGCFGTSIEGFAGAVCPEYDLPLSQFAMLYTNHFEEAHNMAKWVGDVLPRAEQYAKQGLEVHGYKVNYSGGAKYGTLMGYDGTVLLMPTEGEGITVYSNYPGANAAAIALAYTDWTVDEVYRPTAEQVLIGTTQVSVEDLEWHEDLDGYLSKNVNNVVQQSAAIYGVHESVARGVAQPGWKHKRGRIVLPTAVFDGREVITAGPGAVPFKGYGDACWLQGLWWFGFLSADDPLVAATYEMISESLTGNYVFNNSWMGVYAAKLGRGADALAWAKRMTQPGVTLFDGTCFGEIVVSPEDFKKTPDIAAHGAFICNVTQMLLNPDDTSTITIFPAIPAKWTERGVQFQNLAVTGGIAVSGLLEPCKVEITLENRTNSNVTRALRVKLPSDIFTLPKSIEGARLDDMWFVIDSLKLSPGERTTFVLDDAQD